MNQPTYGSPPAGWQPPPPANTQLPVRKKHKKWPWIVAGVVALIVIIAGTAGRNTSPNPAGQAGGPAATTAPAAPAAPAQPTTHSTSTAPPSTAQPPAPPVVKSGRGDDVVSIDRSGVKIVKFDCPRCTGNTVLETDGAEMLLVNTIGKYHGQHWVDIRDHSLTSTYTIKATGAWTLTVGGLDLARTVANGPVTGTGDDVVLLGHQSKAAAITNKGQGNFAVWVVNIKTSTINLAVNEIGGYSGTVPFSSPAIVQVNSEGNWTITPQT